MSAIAISVDAARDAAHRAHTDARESFTTAIERAESDAFAELRAASVADLSRIVFRELNVPGPKDAVYLIDQLIAAARRVTACEYGGDDAERRIALHGLTSAYRLIEATCACRMADDVVQG